MTATELSSTLKTMNVKAQCMHSDHSQAKREQTLRLFRKGAIRFLVVRLIFYFFYHYLFNNETFVF